MSEGSVGSEDLISRDGPEPTYEKVRRFIADEITTGRIRPGSRLAPERSLCEQLGVSRVTLRRGLRTLVDDGLLTPSAGRGWYATPGHLSEPPNALMSFTALARARGQTPTTRVLSHLTRTATSDEADDLDVAAGGDILALDRLRLFDGVPIAIMLSRIPLARVPETAGVDFTNTSLYQVFEERCGVMPTRADYAVEAQTADEETASLLEIQPGAPILVATQTTFDQRGRPVECGRTVYRGDRYRFRATLTVRSTSPTQEGGASWT